MTLREILNLAQFKLKTTSTSPALDAEVLLCFTLGKSKEFLFMNPNKKLSSNQVQKYKKLINKRANGWPVAYLTNHKSFYGLDFYVDKNVLIPRPVTEELVEMVLERKKTEPNLSVLDIGTGSGCVIISLAKNSKGKFFASDVSKSALKIARKNAKVHKAKITFKQGSLLKPWTNQYFDIIVANLPYLAKETNSSTKHEPTSALIAKNKGLALIEQLFQEIFSILTPHPSALFLEIGHDHRQAITRLTKKYLPDYSLTIKKDFTGRTRFAVLQLKTRH